MTESDFSNPCIIGFGSSPSRCGPPASEDTSGQTGDLRFPSKECACMPGLRPRRVAQTLATTRPWVLPSANRTASAPGSNNFTRLNGWRARTPAGLAAHPVLYRNSVSTTPQATPFTSGMAADASWANETIRVIRISGWTGGLEEFKLICRKRGV